MTNLLTVIINLLIFEQIVSHTTNLKALAFRKLAEQPCIGKHQMGIDAAFDIVFQEFEPIKFIDFDKIPSESIIKNDAHVLRIELNYNDTAPTIQVNFESSLDVKGTFRLEYLYFQWYKQVPQSLAYENLTFPAELHAVFYDVNATGFKQAVPIKKGIIILAFGLKVDPLQHDGLDVLLENLKYVRPSYAMTPIENVNLKYWLNSDIKQFYAYEGSFLEFYCQGTVIWIDFADALTITPAILQEFQELKADKDTPLMMEISEIVKPKGKVFSNIVTPVIFGNAPVPPLTLDANNNSVTRLAMPGLLILKQTAVLIMLYCLV